jgi:pimeloyl-ACP methyl ester carboxylesterase
MVPDAARSCARAASPEHRPGHDARARSRTLHPPAVIGSRAGPAHGLAGIMHPSRLLPILLTLILPVGSAAAAAVDGAEINWQSTGSGSRAAILVHGWSSDLTIWNEQVPALARHHRVITLDLPGHGRSGAPRDGVFTMDLFARAVEAVRAEAGIEEAVLVGHSMGATVVARYAQLYPDRVRAIVLVDGYLLPPDLRRTFIDSLPPMQGPDGITAREAFAEQMFTDTTHERVRNRIRAMMLRTPEATAVGALAAMRDPEGLGFGTIEAPVLGIFVRAEPPQAFEAAMTFTSTLIPGLRVEIMPGLGHFLMLEKPAEFNERLVPFVAEQLER